MAIPSPAVPTFTDGQLVHATDLNALGSNITNLFNYNQGGFSTQRPLVIAQQTIGQSIPAGDQLITFNSAAVNTNNMWVASQPTQITIQTAGVYWIFAQVRWPTTASASNWAQANLMANGTTPQTNTVAMSVAYFTTSGSGTANQVGTLINLAVGATLFLDVFQTAGTLTTATNFGGSYMGAVFLTPSS